MFEFIPGLHQKITEILNPFLEFLHLRLRLSPNQISLIGSIFGFGSIVFVVQERWVLATITLFIYYILDLVDGHVARKFGLETRQGKVLDLVIDRGIALSMLGVVVWLEKITPEMALLSCIAVVLMSVMKEKTKIDIGLKNIILGYFIGFHLAINVIFFVNLFSFVLGLVILDYKHTKTTYD